MKTEASRLADLLSQAYFGDEINRNNEAWHGPSLAQVLEGASYELAILKLPGASHTIWEITAHVAQWDGICLRRLAGENLPITTGDEGDWPAIAEQSESHWHACLLELRSVQQALVSKVQSLFDDFLERCVPGWPWTNYVMMHGTLHHDIYHAGQISLLRRLSAKHLLEKSSRGEWI